MAYKRAIIRQAARLAQRMAKQGGMADSGIMHVHVAHDDWCAHWQGGECSCSPDMRLVDDQGRELSRVDGAAALAGLN